MNVKLDVMEIAVMQRINRKPIRFEDNVTKQEYLLIKYLVKCSLITSQENAFKLTTLGKETLKNNLPVIINKETDLNEPIGFSLSINMFI